MVLYANHNKGMLMPARMPKVNDEQWRLRIVGGVKYRPTFLAMMANEVGLKPFEDPQPTKTTVDEFGQPGDRQNYASPIYVCPEVREWTDERNGAYGYNYQFLGNARLRDDSDVTSYKNWSVPLSRVKAPGECVAVGDSMGTAASFPVQQRSAYEDNEFHDSRSGRTLSALGNEGFNLDPPRVDPSRGEMAGFGGNHEARTAVHDRHNRKGNVLWVDVHASSESLEDLGYKGDEDGVIGFEGDNRMFSIDHVDEAWIEE